MEKFQRPFGTGIISRLLSGRFHGSFVTPSTFITPSTHIVINGENPESLMKLSFMYRYTQVVSRVQEGYELACELIEDQSIVDKIFDKIKISELSRIGPAIVPEPEELNLFVTRIANTMSENSRLAHENYRLHYQLENVLVELEKSRGEVKKQLPKLVAEETTLLRQQVEFAEESAASMFIELEIVKKLHKVDLHNKKAFDLVILQQASDQRIANLKSEIKKLQLALYKTTHSHS